MRVVGTVMTHDHSSPGSPDWGTPDFCPCGAELRDGGAGFGEHAEESDPCRRFEEWRENVADDVGGEWSG